MKGDPELRRIAQSIVRKEATKSEVDEEIALYFDLEITELRDMFEMRTMLLLRRALFQDDPEAIPRFIKTLKNSANPELLSTASTNMFEQLIRHILSKLSREAKDEVIIGLSIFDDSLAEE